MKIRKEMRTNKARDMMSIKSIKKTKKKRKKSERRMLIIKNVCRPRHAIQVIYRTPVINQNPQQMSDRDTKSF